MSRSTLTGNPDTNLYKITYRDPNRRQARKVVQSLRDDLRRVEPRRQARGHAQRRQFIDDQIKHYEAGLKAAEDRLKEFKLQVPGRVERATQNYFSALDELLNDQIEATRLQLRAAEESRDAYKRELAGEAPVLLPEGGEPRPRGWHPGDRRAPRARSRPTSTCCGAATPTTIPTWSGSSGSSTQLEEQRKTGSGGVDKLHRAARAHRRTATRCSSSCKIALAAAEANVASLRATLSVLRGAVGEACSPRVARAGGRGRARAAQSRLRHPEEDLRGAAGAARVRVARRGRADAGGTRFKVIDPPRVSPQPVVPEPPRAAGLALRSPRSARASPRPSRRAR